MKIPFSGFAKMVLNVGAAAVESAETFGLADTIRYKMAEKARQNPEFLIGLEPGTGGRRFADALGFDPADLAVAELRSLGVRTLESLSPKEPKFAERNAAIQAILNAGAAGVDLKAIEAPLKSEGLNAQEILAGSRLLNAVEQALNECAQAWRSTPARLRTGIDPQLMAARISDNKELLVHLQATTLIGILERHLSRLEQVDDHSLNPSDKALFEQIRTLLSAQSQYLAKTASDPAQTASQRADLLKNLEAVVIQTMGYLGLAEQVLPDHLPNIDESLAQAR